MGNIDNRVALSTEVIDEDLANAVADKYGVLYSEDGMRLLKCKNKKIKEYKITKRTQVICDNAFSDCCEMTKVSLPEGLTTIGNEAFFHCDGLKEIIIPNSVTSIRKGAFRFCLSLSMVIIPNSVTSIECDTFYCCTLSTVVSLNPQPPKLKSLDYAFGNDEYDGHVYFNVNRCVLYVPNGSKDAYCNAEGWKDFYNIKEIGTEDSISNFQNCILPFISSAKIKEIKKFFLDRGVSDVDKLYCNFSGMLGFIKWCNKYLLINVFGYVIEKLYDEVILLSGSMALCKCYKESSCLEESFPIVDEQVIVSFTGDVLVTIDGADVVIEQASNEYGLIILRKRRFTEPEIMKIKYYLCDEFHTSTVKCPQCGKELVLNYCSRAEEGHLECCMCGKTIMGSEIKKFYNYLPIPNKMHIMSALNFSKILQAIIPAECTDWEEDWEALSKKEWEDYCYHEDFESSRKGQEVLKCFAEIENQNMYAVFSVKRQKLLFPFQPNNIVIDYGRIYIQTALDREKNSKGHPYSKELEEGKYKYLMSSGYFEDEDRRYVGEVAEHVDYTFVNGPCFGLTLLQAFKKKPMKVLEYLYSKSLQLSNEAINEIIAACRKSKKEKSLILARDMFFNFYDVNSADDKINARIVYNAVGSKGIEERELLPYYYGLSFYDVFCKDSSYIAMMVQSGCLSISYDALEGVSELEGYSKLVRILEDKEREREEQEEYEWESQRALADRDEIEQANRDFEDMMNDFDAWGNID